MQPSLKDAVMVGAAFGERLGAQKMLVQGNKGIKGYKDETET